VALLLRDDEGRAPDQRAIASGTLGAIRALARQRPVALAIDDAQWLDGPSSDVLAFVLRRFRDASVALITSWRTESLGAAAGRADRRGSLGAMPDRPVIRIEVGPLSLGAVHRLLRTRTSLEFNRRTLQRIHDTSGGNPFYALELARALEGRPGLSVDGRTTVDRPGPPSGPGEPLPLSTSLNDLLTDRLAAFDPMTRNALLVAAATSPAPVRLVEAALECSANEAFEPAIRSAIVVIDGETVHFTHPLFAAAAYSVASVAERRRWHARIAEVATDQETRARHLAFARPGRDAEVAAELADAARSARARGATGAAAQLYAQALDRWPELPAPSDEQADAAVRRATLVAEASAIIRMSGEPDRARRHLEESIAAIPASPLRAELLLELVNFVGEGPGGGDEELRLVEQAIVEAEGDARRMAHALLDREMAERGRDRAPAALPIARRALEVAEASGDERLLAAAHVRTADLEVVLGVGGDPIARFQRALELGERVHVDVANSAKAMLAVCLIRGGRVDEARPYLLDERARAIAEGDETGQSWMCLFLAELEWLAGQWDATAAYAEEGFEVAEQAGLGVRIGVLQSLKALVEGSRGDVERARALGRGAVAILDDVVEVAYGHYARQVLGFLEISLGNAAAARELQGTYDATRGIEGSKRLSFVGDTIEGLVTLGDVEAASKLADELDRRGAALSRPTLTGTAARCRALILGARGDLEGATRSAESSVATFEELRLPFEHARSLLVLGEVQRRAKARKSARDTLTAAAEAFERLGAMRWADRAKSERARIGGRTTIEGLSETELRVAELVATGRSNKEVAAELFVSVRAVEANLSRVYAKLGIESRTELARRI
jgi:DNA-binding CsgD family transcriptional regulator